MKEESKLRLVKSVVLGGSLVVAWSAGWLIVELGARADERATLLGGVEAIGLVVSLTALGVAFAGFFLKGKGPARWG